MEIQIKVLVEKENWKGYVLGVTMSRCLIGRGNCDLVLTDPMCSLHHALLFIDESGRTILRDLRSRFGTRVNGQKVQECVLRVGDCVSIGETRLTIQSLRIARAMRDENTDSGSWKQAA